MKPGMQVAYKAGTGRWALGTGLMALDARHWAFLEILEERRSDDMAKSAMVPANEVRSFRDLLLWQEAMDLAVDVHRAARLLPADERYELGREIRRSSTSIPSNVSEGFNRHSRKAHRSHIAISLGSTGELETQVELVRRLDLLEPLLVNSLLERCGTVGRLGQGLWRSLKPIKSESK